MTRYPDLVDAWWQAHPEGPCGWDPPTEEDVRRWAAGAELSVDEAGWWTLGDAARPLAGTPAATVIDLRELAGAPVEPPKHWIEVRVVDTEDAPIRGVAVTLIRPDGARERASTDADGVARWRKLPGGRARVVFDDDVASYAEVG